MREYIVLNNLTPTTDHYGYDPLKAFEQLQEPVINWEQSKFDKYVKEDDIVYIWMTDEQRLICKCKIIEVGLETKDIDDWDFVYTLVEKTDEKHDEYMKKKGPYVKLEKINEFHTDLFGIEKLRDNPLLEIEQMVITDMSLKNKPYLKAYINVIEEIIDAEEMVPDEHDGCYELMREIIKKYNLAIEDNDKDFGWDSIDWQDFELVYFSTALTKDFDLRRKNISNCNLPDDEKKNLMILIDEIEDNAKNHKYQNRKDNHDTIGMFITPKNTYKPKETEAKRFKEICKEMIGLCINIYNKCREEEYEKKEGEEIKEFENEIFTLTEKILEKDLKGIQAGISSAILHTLEPTIFPILNGRGGVYELLGVELTDSKLRKTYIENCRRIKAFRDNTDFFPKIKNNYRIFDLAFQHNPVEYILTITKDGMESTDEDFKYIGDGRFKHKYHARIFEAFDAFFQYEEGGEEIRFMDDVGNIKQNTLGKLVCQQFEANLESDLTEDERKKFPVTQDNNRQGIFLKGSFSDYKALYGTEGTKFKDKICFYSMSVFSNLMFAWACLDRFGEPGNRFVLAYRKKDDVKNEPKTLTSLPQIDDGSIDYNYVKNVIFYGPPGTGKTRRAKKIAEEIVGGKIKKNTNKEKRNKIIEEQVKIVQFHPAYSYEDFVRGVTAETDEGEMLYKSEKKIFEEFAELANENQNKRYVIIIDEINRANVSSVFGELLYALEYRGQAIMSPYKRDDNGSYRLTIPDNLYVFGTMNTADRSLQNLDYAIRRRFSFVKVESEKPSGIRGTQKEQKKPYYQLEKSSFQNEKYFFNKVYEIVKKDIEISCARDVSAEDIMPGISYFIVKEDGKGTDVPDKEHAKYKIQYELIPLLKEYAKDGMFTKMKNIELGEEKTKTTLIESLLNDTYKDCLLKMIEGIQYEGCN